ncbi:MAG: hypothetical protein CBC04_04695 [Verrucomicrobia bacterium TMED44]|nr:MAG: hypothetical protein CBC04_04695 [Verrucomicrobia bacterium TMED44]
MFWASSITCLRGISAGFCPQDERDITKNNKRQVKGLLKKRVIKLRGKIRLKIPETIPQDYFWDIQIGQEN